MDKTTFRQECLQRLKKVALQPNKIALDKKTNKNLQSLIAKIKPNSILFYMPLKYEVDVKESIAFFKRRKIKLLVPFMRGDSFLMVEYRVPMRVGRFGILEPTATKKIFNKVDCAVVPIIGVDSEFARIGHGKGMYDRFFETLKNKPIAIFIQRTLLQSKEKLGDRHDIKAGFVVTPTNTVKRGDRYASRNDNNRHCLCNSGGRRRFYTL